MYLYKKIMLLLGYLITFATWSIWFLFLVNVKSQRNGFNKFLILSSFLLGFYSISFGLFGIQFQFFSYKLLPVFICLIYLFTNKLKVPK